LAQYENIGCRIHVIPHKNWLRPERLLRWTRRLAAEYLGAKNFSGLLRQVQPDVVYINTLVSFAAAIAARRLRIPCIWHLREQFSDVGGEMGIPALGGKALVRRVIRHGADHAVAISRAVRENVLGQNTNPAVTIVPNAVDDRFFTLSATRAECRNRLGLPVDGLLVGVPGTLRPVKGHEFFLKAAAQLAARRRECHFAITGEGETRFVEQLHEAARQSGLGDRVRFLGPVSDMAAFYRACDVICVPSRAESFGRIVIEAFAVGTPVVASAVGGIGEIIADGETGLLVNYGDVETLAGHLDQLLREAPLRERLAKAARDDALSRFQAATYHQRINDIVRHVAASGSPGRKVTRQHSASVNP
jgi:glycosyltransferase involved in cell wall biosynthesis